MSLWSGTAVCWLVVAVCATAQADRSKARQEKPMISNSWQGITPGVATPADAQARFGQPERIADNVIYGSVDRLQMYTYDTPQGSLFFRDGKLAVFVLIPQPEGGFPLDVKAWEEALGKPDRKFASIRGKNQRLWVWADRGLTATEDAGRVNLVEMFTPMRAEDYEKSLYKKPPVFIK
jgi:hypothetical protein